MINRITRLRWRRKFRYQKKQFEMSYEMAEQGLDKHLFNRIHKIIGIRRFLFSWFLLFSILIGGLLYQWQGLSQYYLEFKPINGGTFTEGIVGSFTDANPMYATTPVDRAVSKLIFSGLVNYDSQNKLVGDLAEKWSVDTTEKIYTFTLRPNLVWHDGKPLTSADVLFTYQTIQNPDAKSPLFSSWKGISIKAIDDKVIEFSLTNPLSSFPLSLTTGIVPKHILAQTPISQLRSTSFNTENPIGSGPFKWNDLQVVGDTIDTRQERIVLTSNDEYYRGKPNISQFIVRTFRQSNSMIKSFDKQELSAMSGLDDVPTKYDKDISINVNSIPITGAVMIFFKTSQEFLSDPKVRQALTLATNNKQILAKLSYTPISVTGPILRGQVGYDPQLTEIKYDIDKANKLLDEAGWVRGVNGIRSKNNKELELNLLSQDNSEYASVSSILKEQWALVGVRLNGTDELKNSDEIQPAITSRSYDVLLYGISIGADPDVFAYWHSTQADIRSQGQLNLSDYKSKVADQALELGRTRTDPVIRAIKYKTFIENWVADAPAIALYQPRFLYVTSNNLDGFKVNEVNSDVDRFNNVQDWTILKEKVLK